MIDALIDSLKQQLSQSCLRIKHEQPEALYLSLHLLLKDEIPLSSVNFCRSFYLHQADAGFTLLGLDSLLLFEAQGKQRFQQIKKSFSSICKQWYRGNKQSEHAPLAFLAFAFDEDDNMARPWQSLANTLLCIPRILLRQEHNGQTLIVNIKVNNNSASQDFLIIKSLLQQLFTHAQEARYNASAPQTEHLKKHQQAPAQFDLHWQKLAQNAINSIHTGNFDKLVASRHYSFSLNKEITIDNLVHKLGLFYPSCSIFCYQYEHKAILGASPERLLSINNCAIQSNAIGGTIARKKHFTHSLLSQQNNNDSSLPFFLKLGQSHEEATESKKLLKEHQFISRSIYQNLDPLCHTLKMPTAPYIMKLRNLYHLETPIKGKLMAQYDVFDCISALHPTPAVAGIPKAAAQQWLLDNEDYHRGWYTGAFGWLDGRMNADLSVMLRCALIDNKERQQPHIHLFSGAGLVAESDVEAEWQETELKMHTIIDML